MIVVYIIIGLIALLLIISAMLPKSYNVEKSAIIKKSVSDVMNNVGDLSHYKQWNPWQQKDKGSESNITGLPKRPGHKYSWKGKKVGAGSLTLRDIDEKHVHFDLEFIKPWKSRARDNWLFEEWGNDETKVTWQDFGALPYPLGRLMGYMVHKNLNRQFTEGLNNLKRFCEM